MIPIFIQSFRDSYKLDGLIGRLKELKLKYKIIYSLNLTKSNKKKINEKIYDSKKIFQNLGREMSGAEIACAYGHIKIYKYIIKKKIPRAIIFEDDAWPTNDFANWYKKKFIYNNIDLLSFISTSGYVKKKTENFKQYMVHKYVSHFNGTAAYLIDLKSCKKIIDFSKGKVVMVADWPINLINHNIKSAIILPNLVKLVKQNSSFLKKGRKKLTKDFFIKKIIPSFILDFFLTFYYIFYIPHILGRYQNLDFYKEHYVEKRIIRIKNFFTKNYIKIIYDY